MAEEREALTESELMEQLQEEMRRITVPEYLRHLLVSLSSMAFQRLGLTPESVDDRDLSQSRMAIDAFEALVDVLSATFSEQEESLFRSALHEMRMAFVRASTMGDDTSAGAGQEEAAAPEEGDATGAGQDEAAAAEGSASAGAKESGPTGAEPVGEGENDGEG